MKFAVVNKGETLVQLVRRLYECAPQSDLKRVLDRFVDANPTLRDLVTMPENTIVAVPDVEGFERAAAATVAPADIVLSVVGIMQKQLGDLDEVLAAPAERQEAREKAVLEVANSPEVRKLVGQEPKLEQRVANIAQQARERANRVKKLRGLQKQVAVEFRSDLDAVLELLAPGQLKRSKLDLF